MDQPTLDGLGLPQAGPPAAEVAADLAVLDAAAADLDAAEAVFARIDTGTDGSCEVCAEPIDAAAMDAEPLTCRCTRHI